MHETTLDHFLGHISHMHMCICMGYDGEKICGKYSLHVPMTSLNLSTKSCMNRLKNQGLHIPVTHLIIDGNVHVCSKMCNLCMCWVLCAILNAAIVV